MFNWLLEKFRTDWPTDTCIYAYTTKSSMMGNQLIDKQAFLRIVGRTDDNAAYLCRKLSNLDDKRLLRISRFRKIFHPISPSWAVTVTWNCRWGHETEKWPAIEILDWFMKEPDKVMKESDAYKSDEKF